MELPPEQVAEMVARQITRMVEITPDIHHVKPHGALYNQSNVDPTLAQAVVQGIVQILPDTQLYAPPKGELAHAAKAAGLSHCPEGFIDRRYQANGELVPRSELNAVIDDQITAVEQALQIASQQQVRHISGGVIHLPVKTLCVHGDSPQALRILTAVRHVLEEEGYQIKANAP